MEYLPIIQIGIIAVVSLAVGLLVASYKTIEFRPFRTSALAMAAMLLVLVWLGLDHDFNLTALGVDETASVVINLVLDVSVFMVAVTGLVTSLTKLSDDGGKSDALSIAKMAFDQQIATQRLFTDILTQLRYIGPELPTKEPPPTE